MRVINSLADRRARNLRLYDSAESWHEGGCEVAVLEEDPLMLAVQRLKNELLRFGRLASAQGNHGHLRGRPF